MKLSLDCTTLTNTRPVDIIRSAGSAGFDLVSLWLQPPALYPLQLVTAGMHQECASALKESGIRVHSLEVFDLHSLDAIRSYRPALELGAQLGAGAAVAINARNPDAAEASDLLATFVELAGEYNLGVNIEPIALCKTATLAQARELIRTAGVDAGIVLDLYHLVRSGGTVADIRGMEPGLIRHVQIDDGVASPSMETIIAEATRERPYPGEGAFPLVELLGAVPTDISWGIEVPSVRRAESGMSAEMQAKAAMAALRRLLSQIR